MAGSTPNWTWNQYAMRLCGMKPPPKASIEKSTDRRSTIRFDLWSPRRRRMPSSTIAAGGASTAGLTRQNPIAITIPISA